MVLCVSRPHGRARLSGAWSSDTDCWLTGRKAQLFCRHQSFPEKALGENSEGWSTALGVGAPGLVPGTARSSSQRRMPDSRFSASIKDMWVPVWAHFSLLSLDSGPMHMTWLPAGLAPLHSAVPQVHYPE